MNCFVCPASLNVSVIAVRAKLAFQMRNRENHRETGDEVETEAPDDPVLGLNGEPSGPRKIINLRLVAGARFSGISATEGPPKVNYFPGRGNPRS